MPLKAVLKTHRTWEDGVGLTLGVMIGLSPWFYDEPTVPVVVLNSALTGLAVLALITNGTRRAGVGDAHQALDVHGVRMNPGALHLREEHLGCSGHAEARVNALFPFVVQREALAFDQLHAGHVGRQAGRRGR